MNDFERIENRFLGNKEDFCEFLACLYNKGMCEVSADFKDDSHFYFRRNGEALGINDASVFSDDTDYIDSVLSNCEGLQIVNIISSNTLDMKKYEDEWKVCTRRQFYKNSVLSETSWMPASGMLASVDACIRDACTRLDKSHSSFINASSSEAVKRNYAMAMDFDDECYAHIDGGLKCFLSTCCNKKVNAMEINWIYTEPEFRNKGYASDLLGKVSDYYVTKGFMLTYHCDSNNTASANTALKAGFTEAVNEIILERRNLT